MEACVLVAGKVTGSGPTNSASMSVVSEHEIDLKLIWTEITSEYVSPDASVKLAVSSNRPNSVLP